MIDSVAIETPFTPFRILRTSQLLRLNLKCFFWQFSISHMALEMPTKIIRGSKSLDLSCSKSILILKPFSKARSGVLAVTATICTSSMAVNCSATGAIQPFSWPQANRAISQLALALAVTHRSRQARNPNTASDALRPQGPVWVGWLRMNGR